MRPVALLTGLLLVAGVSWLTFYQASATDLGFEGDAVDLVAVALTAALMVAGIFFGTLFRRLAGPERRVDIAAELREVLASSSFFAALCASPFVFFGVYIVVRGAPGDPASYLLAFQNGFFCEAIFRRLFPEGAPAPDRAGGSPSGTAGPGDGKGRDDARPGLSAGG